MLLRILLVLSLLLVLAAMALLKGQQYSSHPPPAVASLFAGGRMDMALLLAWPFLRQSSELSTTKHPHVQKSKTSSASSCSSGGDERQTLDQTEEIIIEVQEKAFHQALSASEEEEQQHHTFTDSSKAALPMWSIPTDFDITKSTRENYSLDPAAAAVATKERESLFAASRYASVRASLDYQYHSFYTPQRQAFQDDLLHYMLQHPIEEQQQQQQQLETATTTGASCTSSSTTAHHQQQPQSTTTNSTTNTKNTTTSPPPLTPQWIIFTAGAMGAGKTFTLQWLYQQGYLFSSTTTTSTTNEGKTTSAKESTNHHEDEPTSPSPSSSSNNSNSNIVISVDPDVMRRHLPEFDIYVQHHPTRAGELTRHEAGLLTELLTSQALRQGHSVVVDGSLRDAVWYQDYFATLKQQHPALQVAILHITAPRSVVLERAHHRAQTTGRHIPTKLLEEALVQVPASVQRLADHVHVVVELANEDAGIRIVEPADMTWKEFADIWKTPLVETNSPR